MILPLRYAGVTLAVVGLGKSGLSAARALVQGGAKVMVWDDNEDARQAAAAEGFKVAEPNDANWMDIDRVIWSPGIPSTFPMPNRAANIARGLNKPLVCDVDLLCESKPEAFAIGVTGTNGKSTTTTLIAHILTCAGHQAAAGGNLGVPALDLPDLPFTGTYVLELSSYQLELVPHLSLDVAVWTNITPDHLSRHGGLNGYVEAKKRLLAAPRPRATAVIGIDDDESRAVCAEITRAGLFSTVLPVRVGAPSPGGISVQTGQLVDETGRRPVVVCDLRDFPALPGAHNWQNAALAYGAARARGIPADRIVAALKTFPGLAHRQQKVGVIEDVAFVNDSKATNADATARALACYDNILWIAGGQAKEGGIDSLVPYFPRIRHAFLIGEAGPAFAKVLEAHNVPCTVSGTLPEAVFAADEMADLGDTVLLSPACASFDQFANFEKRGDAFTTLVQELAEDVEDDGA